MHTQTEFSFVQLEQPLSQSFFTFADAAAYLYLKPNYNITFNHEGKTVGCLDWNDGTMRFSGSADESARVFFENVIERFFKNPDSVGPSGWKS